MATSVANVVGRNARDIRREAGVTLDRLAVAMKLCGLRWSTGRIGSFESGHVPARIETLYMVALALGQATGRSVRLADLFADDDEVVTNDEVVINDELSVDLSALREAVSGRPVTIGETEMTRKVTRPGQLSPREMTEIDEIAVRVEFREADFRVCKKLGVTPVQGAAAMCDLWARTFSRERDRLAGPDAKPQHRGNISRQLQADLQAELEKARFDGND
jgi:transcriptional regulator with XRE-family HTH domain